MLLFAEIWSSSFHQWKYERKIAIRLCSFLCRTKVKTSLYFFSQLLLLAFMTFFWYANILLDDPKNSKHQVRLTLLQWEGAGSWCWLPTGSDMLTVYPGVVSQLHSVRNPFLGAARNYPYSCHGVFTGRSIISLNLARIQTLAGTLGPITGTYVIFNWRHQAPRLKRKTAIFPHRCALV